MIDVPFKDLEGLERKDIKGWTPHSITMNKNGKKKLRCSQCGRVKPVSRFSPRKDRTRGYSYLCKTCDARRKKEERTENKKNINKVIRTHGYGNKSYRQLTKTEKREFDRTNYYMGGGSKKRRKYLLQRLLDAITVYGRKCGKCNEKRMLEFHHRQGGKNESTSTVITRIIENGKKIRGIELLCPTCHRLVDLRDGTANKGSLYLELLANGMKV